MSAPQKQVIEHHHHVHIDWWELAIVAVVVAAVGKWLFG